MKTGLNRECLRQLRDTFGVDNYRPGQKEAANALLSGRDVMCILPTGAGKSLCWQLPAVVHEGVTLVVSPLIALMRDQVEHLHRIGIPAISLDSLMTDREREEAMECILSGGVRIVFVSPERLRQSRFRHICSIVKPWLVVVDEAHCILQWGNEFRPSYAKINNFLQILPNRPVICAMTATADLRMQHDIVQNLGMRHVKRIVLPHIRENLAYETLTTLNVPGKIINICLDHPCKTVVFCRTRLGAERMSALLNQHSQRAAFYHAGMDRQERLAVQVRFQKNEIQILFATSAFGMGVDIPDIRRVIHDHLPDDLIDYAQQSGRAGRDGEKASCILLFEPNDLLVKAGIYRKSLSDKGRHPFQRWMCNRKCWHKLERLLRVMLASDCIASAMAGELGRKTPPCGVCSACRRGRQLRKIPQMHHMQEWEIRLWLLLWQREKIALRQGCSARKIVPDRVLGKAAKALAFSKRHHVPDELERMLAHFRGEDMHHL